MAAPSPSLSLSDIMHPFSPPPTAMQPKSTSPPPRAKSLTPEPLEVAEIEDMRRKILAMGWSESSKGKEKVASREQELVDMLLRLTHPAALPQPSQLHAQAETIAHLIQQRDFLVKRSMEERERWETEKEGWARAAQALIILGRREAAEADKDDAEAAQYSLVTADASTQRMQEFERANVTLLAEKKVIQQKLIETQKRLTSLESELAQLRPLLLMQPYALTHSHPTGTARGWSAVLPNSPSASASRREKDRRTPHADPDVEDELESDDELPQQPRPQFRSAMLRPAAHERHPAPSESPGSPFKPKGDYYRRREPPTPSVYYPSTQYPKSGRGKSLAAKPVLSDARAEHLLLAARKIGRHRASILSGAFAHVPQPDPPVSHYKKSATMPQPKAQTQPPRTPRRNANANTPLLTRTPLGQPSGQQPRTPLQSLLSAAKSVLSAPGSTSPSAGESPVAKRRKLDPSITAAKGPGSPPALRKEKEPEQDDGDEKEHDRLLPGGVARVKSALDFLADQAEVYSTQPPSQESADSGESPPKDIEDGPSQDVEMEGMDDSTSAQEKGKGKTLTERANLSLAADDQLQPDQHDSRRNSRATTPTDVTPRHPHPPDDSLNPRGSTPGGSITPSASLSLAPPINLTPRPSRSPVPPAEPRNTRKRSRSASAAPPSPAAESSFSTFSLQNPQPVAEQAVDLDAGATSRVVEGVKFAVDVPPRRTRSPYIKWTKEEDELLAKAVAKHGQKWDLVQKALPSRGYHQVRQRWLRKLGVFDNSKIDLASLETNAAAEFLHLSTAPPTDETVRPAAETRTTANPKLGLAPLGSERVLTGSSGSRSLSPFPTGSSGGGPTTGFPFPSNVSNPQSVLPPQGEAD